MKKKYPSWVNTPSLNSIRAASISSSSFISSQLPGPIALRGTHLLSLCDSQKHLIL